MTDKQISRKKQLTESGKKKETITLKDVFIVNELNQRIVKFEDIKSKKLGFKIEMYSAKELANYLMDETRPGSGSVIDFVGFSRDYIEKLKLQGRSSTAGNLNRTINAVIDFCNGRDKVPITEITAKFLEQFESFLRGKRTIKRKNQFGKLVASVREGLSDVSVFDYMTDLRVLFNAALAEFNDEDKDDIKIFHYPFRKYKLKRRPENEKRNLSSELIAAISSVSDERLSLDRAILARDVFMLSFYLVGMNLADMYQVSRYDGERLSYERKKTKGRRQDRAFISIRVEPEAAGILNKYLDPSGERVFDFYRRYTNSHIFSSNINKGLKLVADACGIQEPLSTYYARHSWATIARNKCGVSKDDIDLALNHIDQGLKMADVYIEKDWSRIDIANRAVLDYIKK